MRFPSLAAAYRQARRVFHSKTDTSYLLKEQISAFAELDLDYEAAIERLDRAGVAYDESDAMCSQHWVFFAAINPKRVLEIGTYNARFTKVIRAIFPEAEIVTCDLPDDSRIFNETYNRDNEKGQFLELRSANLSAANATFIQKNSFFLPTLGLGKFDAIWVDGGHDYPDVAWDACNAIQMIDNGFILFDDVYRHEGANRTVIPDYNDSAALLEYFSREKIASPKYIHKRMTADSLLRKHIGILDCRIRS